MGADAQASNAEPILFESARVDAERPGVGVFAGVPSFIKDNDAVAGSPFLFGSRALPNTPAPKSTAFVEQFLSLGFVNLGKTTMPEFGLTGTTEALLHGPTHNPWRLGFSPGGSSGGWAGSSSGTWASMIAVRTSILLRISDSSKQQKPSSSPGCAAPSP